MRCVEARLHSGVGNWIYLSVEVALLALATNATLVLPAVLHEVFSLPLDVLVFAPGQGCQTVRHMQVASSNATTRLAVAARTRTDFASARQNMFQRLFSRPRRPPPHGGFATAVHVRTVSDVRCASYRHMRACARACVRKASLRCVAQHALSPVLVLSDSARASESLVRMLEARGLDAADEAALGLNATDHSALSERAARRTLALWIAFALARRRFASGISTFSKSALLARPGALGEDFVVDSRCQKKHAVDGALFTCRWASVARDLVR